MMTVSNIDECIKLLKPKGLDTEENLTRLTLNSNLSSLYIAIVELMHAKLLSQVYFDLIVAHKNPHVMAKVTVLLVKAKSWNAEIQEIVVGHQHLSLLLDLMTILSSVNPLLPSIFIRVLKHPDLNALYSIFFALQQAKILSVHHIELVVSHHNLIELAKAIRLLRRTTLFSNALFKRIVSSHHPYEMVMAMQTLHLAKIFTSSIPDWILQHDSPKFIALLFEKLNKFELLTKFNSKKVREHPDPEKLFSACCQLIELGLFSQSTFDLVVHHVDAESLALGLTILKSARLLNLKNMNLIALHPCPADVAEAMHLIACSGFEGASLSSSCAAHVFPLLLAKLFLQVFRTDLFPSELTLALLAKHPNVSGLGQAIDTLATRGLLTEENLILVCKLPKPEEMDLTWSRIIDKHRDIIASHPQGDALSLILVLLAQLDILTDENLLFILAHVHPLQLTRLISYLDELEILNMKTLDMVVLYPQFDDLIVIINELKKAGRLTQENFEKMVSSSAIELLDPAKLLTLDDQISEEFASKWRSLGSVLVELNGFELLSQANCNLIVSQNHPHAMALAICVLANAKSWTPQTPDLLAGHQNFYILLNTVMTLSQIRRLTLENFVRVANHACLGELNLVISYSKKLLTYSQSDLEQILSHQNLNELVEGLNILTRIGLLSSSYFRRFLLHPHPQELATAFEHLFQAQIISMVNLDLFFSYQSPELISRLFVQLAQIKILTKHNCKKVAKHAHLKELLSACSQLNQFELFSQSTFELVMNHADPEVKARELLSTKYPEVISKQHSQAIAVDLNPPDVAESKRLISDFELVMDHADSEVKARELVSTKYPEVISKQHSQAIAVDLCPPDVAECKRLISNAGFGWMPVKPYLEKHAFPYILAKLFLQVFKTGLYPYVSTLESLATHSNVHGLHEAAVSLASLGLLTEENLILVCKFIQPQNIAWVLACRAEAGGITASFRNLLASHTAPSQLERMFAYLLELKILNARMCEIVVCHSRLDDLMTALEELKDAALLTQDNFEKIALSASPLELARAFSCLQQASILTPDNQDAVVMSSSPYSLALSLAYFRQHGSYNPEYTVAIIDFPEVDLLASILCLLIKAGISSIANFELLLMPCCRPLFKQAVIDDLNVLIDKRLLNQETYDQLLQTAVTGANLHQKIDALIRFSDLWRPQQFIDSIALMKPKY